MRRELWILTFCFTLTSCLGSGLRRDLDDYSGEEEATVGGVWPEGGLLSQERGALGHSDRSPASALMESRRQTSDWVSKKDRATSHRDFYRFRPEAMRFADGADVDALQDQVPEPKRSIATSSLSLGKRAVRGDFVDSDQNEGSLWAGDGQSNFYFTKNKTRGPGDLVTINVEEDLVRDTRMSILKSLSEDQREIEEDILKDKVRLANEAAEAAAENAKEGAKTAATEPARFTGVSEKDLASVVEIKAGDKLTGEVVERYPNGNYKIQGVKRVPYRGTAKFVNFTAIAKGSEIGDDDSIASSKLYEYRLQTND